LEAGTREAIFAGEGSEDVGLRDGIDGRHAVNQQHREVDEVSERARVPGDCSRVARDRELLGRAKQSLDRGRNITLHHATAREVEHLEVVAPAYTVCKGLCFDHILSDRDTVRCPM
jgi:hypothetical protein